MQRLVVLDAEVFASEPVDYGFYGVDGFLGRES